ncbi:MAG: TMEM175 family protein [Sphingomonas bacterium]|nr:TMEM175 family protein [Sphingomonas bacterium]
MSKPPPIMKPARLSAFTDGVIAIIITIMVLELPVPHGAGRQALAPLWPVLGAYALSFVNIGIFWNNHHHLMHLVRKVNGRVLWANLLLLFWLSLVPFVIRWIGEAHVSPAPVAAYGLVLTMAALSYWVLERAIIAADVAEEGEAPLELVVGSVVRERLSVLMYVVGAAVALVSPWLAVVIYVAVAAVWFAPDRRVEKEIEKVAEQAGDPPPGP